MAQNMRQNALSEANARCPVCKDRFMKKRAWQTFCSPKCRKASWAMSKRTGTYIDVRKVLAGIIADLGAIKEFFGIETRGPGQSPRVSTSQYKSSPVLTRPGEPRQPGRARSEVPASPERQARSPHRVNASRQPGRVSAQGAIMKGE